MDTRNDTATLLSTRRFQHRNLPHRRNHLRYAPCTFSHFSSFTKPFLPLYPHIQRSLVAIIRLVLCWLGRTHSLLGFLSIINGLCNGLVRTLYSSNDSNARWRSTSKHPTQLYLSSDVKHRPDYSLHLFDSLFDDWSLSSNDSDNWDYSACGRLYSCCL